VTTFYTLKCRTPDEFLFRHRLPRMRTTSNALVVVRAARRGPLQTLNFFVTAHAGPRLRERSFEKTE
jgi:hypothetical protein